MADTKKDTLPAPRLLEHALSEYYLAPSGEGPLASEWKNKPHRLVYDLIAANRLEAMQVKELVDMLEEIMSSDPALASDADIMRRAEELLARYRR